MARVKIAILTTVFTTLFVGTPVLADDGAQTLKSMSRNADVTVLPEDVGVATSESEHAFIDMMKFYVPSQGANGLLQAVEYLNADEELVESLPVAKPLVSVFIYGPAIEVEGTAFLHSFQDAFAAVSLDDGETWKTTNLSESADQSSFELGQSSGGGGGGNNASAAVASLTVSTLTSNSSGRNNGRGVRNDHADPVPTILTAVLVTKNKNKDEVQVTGEGAPAKERVTLINAVTGETLDKTKADRRGNFEFTLKLKKDELPPCSVAVVVDNVTSDPVRVVDKNGDIIRDCEGDPGVDLTNYPGGVHNVVMATKGNKVLVAWPSRYCQQGQPAYALENDTAKRDAIVSFIQTGETADDHDLTVSYPNFSLDDDLYLVDAFGVAGSQGSIDFADEEYPQAGEVPFGCVWTARGVLLPGDDPRTDETEATHMVWTKAERLTSGRRDPYRLEVHGIKDVGFVLTWQEDPEGLRPGQGEGPGEGWSGAVAHSQTDVWYSYINWAYFDVVDNGEGAPINIVSHDLTTSGRPQVFVPMAIPMRLTNNAKCNTDGTNVTDPDLYCNYGTGDTGDGVADAADFGLKDQCADSVEIPTGPNNTPTPICVSEDGLPNIANTAATRPRTSLQGRDSDGDGVFESAWVIVATEESKGLGRFFFLPDGTPCEEGSSDDCVEDIGKNIWYFSFDMGTPDTSADLSDTGLVRNLVGQGDLLNQPEVYWMTGDFYPPLNTADMWALGDYDFDIYRTEIARRSSLLVQSVGAANSGTSGILALPSWKQGPMRQGGPADTMLRRIVDQDTSDNPYAYTNVICQYPDGSSGWMFTDGSNPYYPHGVCMAPATNLSSAIPDTCIDTQTGDATPCPSVDFSVGQFGKGDTNPILQGEVQGEGNTTKVLTWHQCPSESTQVSGDFTAVNCETDTRTDQYANLYDQSWYNPLDVSKGHRGFLDGDMVMFLYAWSPNWRLNTVGNDRYELYVRRSFDGGATWTTTPASGTASDGVTDYAGDGTVTCETYRTSDTGTGDLDEPRVCNEYPAGGAEQARNVTQHQAMRITTLDPRYAPTYQPGNGTATGTIGADCVDPTDPTIDTTVMTCDDTSALDSDVRDPSRYFIVYETGDNTTVADGEAEPLGLFYSRAINFGDDYAVWAENTDLGVCYPSDAHGDDISEVLIGSGFCNEFDRLNAGGVTHSSEADLEANPNGSKLYGVWAQWVYGADGEEIIESDAMVRRLWWIDDYIPSDAWVPGQGQTN